MAYNNERQMIIDWFEGDFKQSIVETTRTKRLDNGKISYAFAVDNTSGFDFSRFSFKVKILNKADGSELGSSVIEAGKWLAGTTKNFKSELSIPASVTGISFVAYSESVSYDGKPARTSVIDDLEAVGREISDAGRNLGDLIENGDASGVFGELFGTGGMPGTVTTETTKTVTIGDKTTTTHTRTTKSPSIQPNSGEIDAGPVRQASRQKTTTTTSRTSSTSSSGSRNSGRQGTVTTTTQRSSSRSSGGSAGRGVAGTYAERKLQKKLQKIRLGKSPWSIVWTVLGAMMIIAAMGANINYELEQVIEYAATGACLFIIAIVLKLMKNSKAKRIRYYESMVNKNGNTVLFDISSKINRPVAKVADDLQEMIALGFFPNAFVDVADGLLVMTDENGEPLVPISDTVAANKRDKRKKARAYGKVPNSIDDLITMTDDSDIKDKLKALEAVTDKINKRVEERPDLADQVKEFSEKFYPEVVRLTDEYNEKIANLDAVDNIRDKSETEIRVEEDSLADQARGIKKQIIKLIDNVIEASENLLEKLHEDDIMDIETDIQALKNKIAREGLMDSDFDIH